MNYQKFDKITKKKPVKRALKISLRRAVFLKDSFLIKYYDFLEKCGAVEVVTETKEFKEDKESPVLNAKDNLYLEDGTVIEVSYELEHTEIECTYYFKPIKFKKLLKTWKIDSYRQTYTYVTFHLLPVVVCLDFEEDLKMSVPEKKLTLSFFNSEQVRTTIRDRVGHKYLYTFQQPDSIHVKFKLDDIPLNTEDHAFEELAVYQEMLETFTEHYMEHEREMLVRAFHVQSVLGRQDGGF